MYTSSALELGFHHFGISHVCVGRRNFQAIVLRASYRRNWHSGAPHLTQTCKPIRDDASQTEEQIDLSSQHHTYPHLPAHRHLYRRRREHMRPWRWWQRPLLLPQPPPRLPRPPQAFLVASAFVEVCRIVFVREHKQGFVLGRQGRGVHSLGFYRRMRESQSKTNGLIPRER